MKLKKILALTGLIALCICAGLTSVLNLKPTTAKAAVNNDFFVYTPEIDLKDSSTNEKDFPKLTVSVNLGKYAVKYNMGSKVTSEIRDYASYNDLPLYNYTRSKYYVIVGLTDKNISDASINQANFMQFEKENGYQSFIKGNNTHGISRMFCHDGYFNPDDPHYKIEEPNGIDPIFGSDIEFLPIKTGAAENFIAKFEIDLYHEYEGLNDSNKPYWDWVSYCQKDLNFYVVVLEEQLLAEQQNFRIDNTRYTYSSKHIVHETDIQTINIANLANEELEIGPSGAIDKYTYLSNLLKWQGYSAPAKGIDIPVNVVYREMTGVTTFEERTRTFTVPFEDAFSKTVVYYELNKKLGVTSYTDFNACWRDQEVLENGIVNLNSERIIYQALGYSYKYDYDLDKVIITVEYTEFFAKDFAIELRSNDPLDDAAIYIYSTSVTSNKTDTTITFDYRTIEEQLYNQKGWIVNLGVADFEITHSPLIESYIDEDSLTFIVDNDKQGLLSYASVSLIAEIIEDIDVTVSYEYQELYLDSNNTVQKRTKTSEPVTMKYSEVISMSSNNFYVIYKDVIDNAIDLDILSNCEYMSYGGVQRVTVEKGVEYKFIVNYEYQMIIKVIHPNETVTYVQASELDRNSNFIESLDVTIPEGERLAHIFVSPYKCLQLVVDEEDYTKSQIYVTCGLYEDYIGVVELVTTDEFFVTVDYLVQYKSTPFAYPATKTGVAKVSDIPTDGTSYTEFLKKFLNVDNLKCLRSNVESIEVTFNGIDTYAFKLKYTYCSLRKIDYNGDVVGEVKVPLTSYKDWAQSMGQDWSILFLNMPNTTYFEYSTIELPNGGTLNEENLYGYFAVAIFEEKASDLNYYFKGYSGDGVVSMFEATQATGSNIYKRLSNIVNRSKFAIYEIPFYPALAFCELLNSDNKMYHAYFFYLDCKVDPNKSYISNGRADSADDTDGAFGNVMQDTADKVGNVFEDIFKKDDGKLKWYTWLIIGFASLLSLAIFIRIIRKK